MESNKIKLYQQQQQNAWDEFVKQRTNIANAYANAVQHAKRSTYEPLRNYANTLPDSLEQVWPSFYLPMQDYVSDEQFEKERGIYNQIAQTINAYNDEIMDKVIEANRKFEEVVRNA